MVEINVEVQTMGGRKIDLSLDKETCVFDLKELLAQHWGAAPVYQKLFVEGLIAEDAQKLVELCQNGETNELQMMLVFNSRPACAAHLRQVQPTAVRWAQRKDSLSLTLELPICGGPSGWLLADPWLQVDVDGDLQLLGRLTQESDAPLWSAAVSGPIPCPSHSHCCDFLNFQLRLCHPVDRDALKLRCGAREVRLHFTKLTTGYWPRLTKEKDPRVSIDWDRWADSDEEDEKGTLSDESMSSVPRPL